MSENLSLVSKNESKIRRIFDDNFQITIGKRRFSISFKKNCEKEKSNEISTKYKSIIDYLCFYYDPGPLDSRENSGILMDEIFWQSILRRDRLGEYQSYLRKKGNIENTINRKLSAISKFTGFLILSEHLLDPKYDPFYRKRRPVIQRNPQRFFDENEILEIYLTMDKKAKIRGRKGYLGKRDRAMFSLTTSRLLRAGAVCNLKASDVNLEKRTFTVVEKGKKKRKFILDDIAYKDLKSFLDVKDDKDEYVFTTERGNPMHHRCWHRILNDYYDGEISPHDIRRSIAKIMHRKGYDIFMLQRLLGHKNIQTTTIYLDLEDLDFEESIKDFNPFS